MTHKTLLLASPLNYQVIQRRTAGKGIIPIQGHCTITCDRVDVRLTGPTMADSSFTSGWLPTSHNPATHQFKARLTAPAGGWYALDVRAVKGSKTVALRKIQHVGVGEVFVGAGQSNSTSCGGLGSTSKLDGRTQPKSGFVSSFDGTRWRIADDPQPGAHDAHNCGSFWPAFGDAMAARYRVPIGVAVTGHAGTSIRQWTKKDVLFQWTLSRLRQLGPGGFRALLWHQGENDADAGMSARSYADGLADIIRGFRMELGRNFPFFVAKVSYITWPKPKRSREIRAAQQLLWARKVALEGPDTDAMVGDLRDMAGAGIHFSRKGLKVHGEAWAEKVGSWLDKILVSET